MSSSAGFSRGSTPFLNNALKDVDGRIKSGHDRSGVRATTGGWSGRSDATERIPL
jgi:hypothetical protein